MSDVGDWFFAKTSDWEGEGECQAGWETLAKFQTMHCRRARRHGTRKLRKLLTLGVL